ncbi:hypothetical protein DL240_07000 [Lujinxingia litoralis]|uniref:Uncharacterized protein n=1 Tax=Lujinxingia litoralis TaxID=2211119 RepID=A0A328CBL5_9DELT|nr:hypothetical protein DL240_07000 [Lujinxingia litoralis]
MITLSNPIERLALFSSIPPEDTSPPISAPATPSPSDNLAPLPPHQTESPAWLTHLPRPFLRPPSGAIIRRHLASELTQHWTEIEELLHIFGNDIIPLLRELTRRGEILLDPRKTLRSDSRHYQNQLYARALESALSSSDAPAATLLPPPVANVDVASHDHVALRERSTLLELDRIDAQSARFLYYPGRIFDSAHGRHIVISYSDDNATRGAFDVGDIIVEPFLGDDITSPQRRVVVELIASPSASLIPEKRFLGDLPIGLGHFPVQCMLHHRATLRLAPHTHTIRQRIYSRDETSQAPRLRTRALGIFPNIDPASALTLAEARLLCAALRAVLPLLYRGSDTAIGTTLHLCDLPPNTSPPSNHLLSPTDAIYVFDLHSDGNGASQTIERDGITPMLHLAQNLLANLSSPATLLNIYDEWDTPLSPDTLDEALTGLLTWLTRHLHAHIGGAP